MSVIAWGEGEVSCVDSAAVVDGSCSIAWVVSYFGHFGLWHLGHILHWGTVEHETDDGGDEIRGCGCCPGPVCSADGCTHRHGICN